ncbi:MAG: alkaline phosphatase family protein [Dehalococcoidia bacterium]|nr:alkaline phosphatase family protein [Dehalococcoidia bacterium]
MPRIVLVVFDGLNPELVTPELMPNLCTFSEGGVRLTNHRPVFPSVTRLNAASMVTGCFPGTHGLHANLSLVPDYHETELMDALEPQLTELRRKAGRVLLTPTLSQILAGHGLEYVAAGVGTSGQAFMHHPDGDVQRLGATIHTDYALPRSLYHHIVDRFGEWPEKQMPNSARVERVTDVFIEYVLAERDPAIGMMWYSEPDTSEHATGPHSPEVQESVRVADAQFGRLLDWLEKTGRDADTNVVVTCDHGQSTISEPVALLDLLAGEGFGAPGTPGGVTVAGNGGAALFYVDGQDTATVDRLVAFLMRHEWAGPIVAADRHGKLEGTVPASRLGLEGPRTPDLLMSFAWRDEPNQHGKPGMIWASGGAAGRGTHGSMSPWEFRTYTVARGPAFKAGEVLDIPTGHPDLAPTFLRVLGLPIPGHMQGRAIVEALAGTEAAGVPEVEVIEATRDLEGVRYRQALTFGRMPGGHAHLVAAEAERVDLAALESPLATA